MNGREGTDQKWCAGFVCFIIGQAAVALNQPMRRQVGVDYLIKDAKSDRRLLSERNLGDEMARRTKIRAGALFAVRESGTDRTHTGIVTKVTGDSFETIEGKTNQDEASNGFEVCSRSRSFGKRISSSWCDSVGAALKARVSC